MSTLNYAEKISVKFAYLSATNQLLIMEELNKSKIILASAAIGVFVFIATGLFWFFFVGSSSPVGFGWYVFSFAAGLSMIVLPCTLPLAFVIVPLSMGKGPVKGFSIALAFGIGIAITLSMYGVIAALVGEVAIGTLGAPLEVVKNWLYFVAGLFAFIFALGELGLVRFRMPTYSGAYPMFIQRQKDVFKALLLGLFLGNIGVGCPHPATPVILTRIASSGDVFYGWSLFFIHAVGRVLPLLFLAILAIIGVNALSVLVKHKDKIERATGWGMVFVAGFILVLGLFTHDWWVNSGQHTLLEEITQEERFLGIIVNRFNLAEPPHAHGPEDGLGLFGLPLWLGNWVLVILWAIPFWWYYFQRRKNLKTITDAEENKDERVKLSSYFLNIILLSVLLGIVFIYILPNRFLSRLQGRELPGSSGMVIDEHEETMPGSLYHEETQVKEGVAVNLNVTPVPFKIGQIQKFDFFVNRKPGNVPILFSELEIEHAKLMHVIGVRSDMNEFLHIHPDTTSSAGILSVNYTFGKPGLYKLWSEIKTGGINHSFGHPEISVQGDGEKEKKQVSFARNIVIDNYQVSLIMDEPVARGHEHDLTFDIHTLTGKEVDTENYLDAKMHLTVIKDDWKQFIHTHPGSGGVGHGHTLNFIKEARANGGGHEEDSDVIHGINFRVVFPEAGLYKAFAQFRPQGSDLPQDEALTVAFWIEVKEKAPGAISAWWWLLISSLAAIAILSWGVRKYLQVKV